MRIAISTIGRFHNFHQAAQLQQRGMLAAIFSGYPRFKLQDVPVDQSLIHTFPYLQTPYMALIRYAWFQRHLDQSWSWWSQSALDRHVARTLPPCDALIALSGMGLHSGRKIQAAGGRFICERASTHKLFQDQILKEEYAAHGFVWAGIDPRNVEKELAEYSQADAILVPSSFVRQTFLDQGVAADKIWQCPFGVSLTRFTPLMDKEKNFRVLFVGQVGIRKGLPYLLQAFAQAKISGAQLVLVVMHQPEAEAILRRYPVEGLQVKGILHGDDLVREMSRAHVMVLPSVEEGMAVVMAECLACGTPVIATPNSGAQDLFTDGEQGFIVPPRSPQAIAEKLVLLAQDPVLSQSMRQSALDRVGKIAGWDGYGERLAGLLTGTIRP